MNREIVVSVMPDGTTSVEANGFRGKGCAEATQAIELAIGGPGADKNKDYKPDFFQTVNNTGHLKQG